MEFIRRIRIYCDGVFRQYPAFAVLISILAVLLTALHTQWGVPALTGIVALLTGLAIILTGLRHAFFRTALPCFLLLCSLYYHQQKPFRDDLHTLLHFRQNAGAELEMTVIDQVLFRSGMTMPESEEELLPAPRQILCRVDSVRFSPTDTKQKIRNSQILLRFRAGRHGKVPLCYGMRLRGQGTLQKVPRPLLAETFDYGQYLHKQGIYYIFEPEALSASGCEKNFAVRFFHFRDRILESILQGIHNPSARALAGGILFGCRQGISREEKEHFLNSGILHILTVSGLHTGMFASGVFLLLLCSGLGLRRQLFCALAAVWIYGGMTGLQMPSLRALIMLSCFCLTRAFLLRTNALNSICLAACILLIADGEQITSSGFQYSFCCVLFLVGSAGRLSELFSILTEKILLVPEEKKTFFFLLKHNLVRKIFLSVSGCLTVWTCSFILTLFHQSLSTHLAPGANMAVLLLVYLVFLIFTVFFLPVILYPPAGRFAGQLMEGFLTQTGKIAEQFSHWSIGNNVLAAPDPWLVLCGLGTLLFLILFPGRKMTLVWLGILCLLILYYLFHGSTPENELLLFPRDPEGRTPWCISMPEAGFCAAGDLPDFRTAAEISTYLKRRGHSSLQVLTSSKSMSPGNGDHFLKRLIRTEKHIILFSGPRRKKMPESPLPGKEFENPLIRSGTKPVRIRHGGLIFEIMQKNTQISFDIFQKVCKLSFNTEYRHGMGYVQEAQYGSNGIMLLPGDKQNNVVKRIIFDPERIEVFP